MELYIEYLHGSDRLRFDAYVKGHMHNDETRLTADFAFSCRALSISREAMAVMHSAARSPVAHGAAFFILTPALFLSYHCARIIADGAAARVLLRSKIRSHAHAHASGQLQGIEHAKTPMNGHFGRL